MFTGDVPQGTGHQRVGSIAQDYAYLDPVIEAMMQQSPDNRPPSIVKIKEDLIGRGNEFVAKQRLDQARKAVVPETTPDDPLGGEDVRVVSADYSAGSLVCQLSAAPAPTHRSLSGRRCQRRGESDPPDRNGCTLGAPRMRKRKSWYRYVKNCWTHYTSRLSSSHLEEMLCEMNWSQPSG